jgi:hypothetical protein
MTTALVTTNTISTTTYPDLPDAGEEISFPFVGLIAIILAATGGIVTYTIRKKKIYDEDGKSN